MLGKIGKTGFGPTLYATMSTMILALALLWPSFINGEPFYMPDTPSYIRAADAGVYKLTGIESAWTNEFHDRYAAGSDETPTSDEDVKAEPSNSIENGPVALAGRSVFYGAFLYLAQIFGNFWLVAVIQSLIVGIAIMLTIKAFVPEGTRGAGVMRILSIGLLVVFLSSAAFFSGFLMPDIFAGLGLLSFVHLAAFWDRQGRAERLFWFGLLLAAMLFHNTNVLITVSLLALVILGNITKFLQAGWRPVLVVVTSILLSFGGQSVFYWGVTKYSGNAPVMPPFLAARVIDDGPGYKYLEKHCGTEDLKFCRVLDFKVINHDQLLWSKEKDAGFFQALPNRERREVAATEKAFVLDVFLEYPVEVLVASFRGFGTQLVTFNLPNFNYNDKQIAQYQDKIPGRYFDAQKQSAAYKNTMPTSFWEISTFIVSAAALLFLVIFIFRSFKHSGRLSKPAVFSILIVVGIFANAAICGALSGPKGRYQMRLVWVLPLAAASMLPYRQTRMKAAEPTE
ncbi:hypothetical protein [Parasphingorhabdus cellanae]|uniref:Uncharacterized protein n=1 Tax=Parasphingorhabdus cellanae TaxID=2806553 RepID=A0ABX7T2U7_9SPHN|nr:hypothetical protein [Parasphingorhabdus cellanae]QTD55879.1 hypothetical protein J4G78_17115 [Parasphingorhabdus cellanae]